MPDYFKKEFDIFVDLNQRENRFFSKLNKKILKSLPYGLKKYLILANSIEKVI